MSYKGVVFNEMKGVYSSPDSIFYRAGEPPGGGAAGLLGC
jgi:Zn-dependent M16 (insulinase) family peptidase